ncbi:MAG: ketopantoate reductase family protein [Candidatus Heimdallarchaeaceae archaeon]
MSQKQILVIGLGAIGSVLAVRLQQEGYKIVAKTSVSGNNLIRAKGLIVKLSTQTKPILYEGEVYSELPEDYKFERCIIATKSYKNSEIANDLLNHLTETGSILLFQNGLEIEQPFLSVNSSWKITRAISSIAVTRNGYKVIEITLGETVIGAINYSDSEETNYWHHLLQEAGLLVSSSKNIYRDIWLKGIANAVINPLGAIAGVTNGFILKDPILSSFAEIMVQEIVSVIPEELSITKEEAWENVSKIIRQTADNKCSMLQDIDAKRKTEIEYLNDVILKIAKKQNKKLPYNRQAVKILKELENNKIPRQIAILRLRSD